MNRVFIRIQNEQDEYEAYDKHVVLPVKYAKLLDEQLDFATVTLSRVKRQEFKPLTKVILGLESNTKDKWQNETTYYFIANDDFFETPVGSGYYQHELTLIELTKFLECFPLETLCFTNPSGGFSTTSGIAPILETDIE